jgi:hypothetical protein
VPRLSSHEEGSKATLESVAPVLFHKLPLRPAFHQPRRFAKRHTCPNCNRDINPLRSVGVDSTRCCGWTSLYALSNSVANWRDVSDGRTIIEFSLRQLSVRRRGRSGDSQNGCACGLSVSSGIAGRDLTWVDDFTPLQAFAILAMRSHVHRGWWITRSSFANQRSRGPYHPDSHSTSLARNRREGNPARSR